MTSSPPEKHHSPTIILFDGIRNLCDGLVQFIIKRDPKMRFRFASLQSSAGQEILQQHGLDRDQRETFLVVDDGIPYARSNGALQIAKRLGGLWRVFTVFRLAPPFLRDALYNFISRNRYRFFGKKDKCLLPTPEHRSRFLDS